MDGLFNNGLMNGLTVLLGGVLGAVGLYVWYRLGPYARWQLEKQELALQQRQREEQLSFVQSRLQEVEHSLVQREQANHVLEKDNIQLAVEIEQLRRQARQWMEEFQPEFKSFALEQMTTLVNQHVQQFQKQLNQTNEEQQVAKETLFKTQLQHQVQTLVKPLSDSLKEYQERVQQVNKEQHHAYKLMDELKETTRNLYRALSHNKGRGDWGEMELTRLLEDSGLIEGIGYVRQQVVGSEGKRPDIQINLPDGRKLFVDAKALQVDLDDVIGTEGDTQEAIEARQKRYAKSLDDAIKNLKSKAYQAELNHAGNFVILYVPRESMVALALSADPTLFERAYQHGVVLAGPFNLMAMLKVVHHSWVMARANEESEQILKLGKDIHKQALTFLDHFAKLGRGLDQTTQAFHAIWRSFDGQQGLRKKVQKLEEYGCQSGKSVPEPTDMPAAIEDFAAPKTLMEEAVSAERLSEGTEDTGQSADDVSSYALAYASPGPQASFS